MQFVLIDDATEHNEILAKKLLAICKQNDWPGQIALKTTEPFDVIAYANDCRTPTVYFLDIELEENETTLSLFKSIQNLRHESYIVYVSAHAQYAMQCLHTHAFDFLLKPWTDEQLTECLGAIMHTHLWHGDNSAKLQIDMGSRLIQVKQNDILFCKREKMNIFLQCVDGSSFVWRETLSHLLEQLDPASFFQCHRSCIVNITHVSDVNWAEDEMRMSNGNILPVSRRRSAELKAKLQGQEVLK